MISTSKTIVYRSSYEAPKCKIYSIAVESVMTASGYGEQGTPGDDMGGDGHDL